MQRSGLLLSVPSLTFEATASSAYSVAGGHGATGCAYRSDICATPPLPHLLLAICTVRLSMYICSVSLPDVSLSTSFWTDCTRASSAVKNNVSPMLGIGSDEHETNCGGRPGMLRSLCTAEKVRSAQNLQEVGTYFRIFSFFNASFTISPDFGVASPPHAGTSSKPVKDIKSRDELIRL